MDQFKRNLPFYVAFILLGVGVYAFNLRGPLFWDDADWILNNPSVHALTWENIKFIFSHDVLAGIGQVSNYYRPFLFLTFLANYLISGAEPVLYHLVSNSIHILNACLIFYLLSQWLSPVRSLARAQSASPKDLGEATSNGKRLAFLASLLFLIHPLQTESVAYISGRGDPLSVFLMLLALIFFIKSQSLIPNTKYLILSVGAMILAVLSRETAVLFPAYLGVTLMAFKYKGLIWERFKKAFVNTLPFIGVSVVYGLLRLTVLNFQNTLNFYQEQNLYSENIAYRIYTFFHALVEYLRLSIWPTNLHMERDIPVSLTIFSGYSWLGALLMIGFAGLLIWLYKKEKILNTKYVIRNTSFNVWFFGLGIFFVNLLPTSGIVPINARIYEHWLYFSLLGLFTIIAFYLDKSLSFLKNKNPKFYVPIIILFIIYCLFLGVQTIRRNILWSNTEKLYLNILHYAPDNTKVLNNLANWYSDEGDNLLAKPLYERAVLSDPTQPAPYHNLGNIALGENNLVEAEALYKKAIEVSPAFHYSYLNLAQLYINQNKLPEAIAELEKLQKIFPTPQTEKNIEMLKNMLSQ